MPRRLAAALATLAALLTTLVVVGTPVSATLTNPGAVGLLALRFGDVTGTDTSRYGVVVMNAWEAGRIPAMKAANPGVKILVYKDMSSTRSYAVSNGVDDALLPTGVGYAWADRNRPEWFLTDGSGARIEWSGYPGHWWMDVGNTDYVDTWVANVSSELASAGWDGVMVDNAIADPAGYLGGRTLPRYPDKYAYRAATDTFLSIAGPRLKAAGLDVVPNLGGNFWDLTTYRRWVGYTSGALREHYGRWGSDGNGLVLTDGNWAHQVEQQEIVESEGKLHIAVAYAKTTDVAFQRYARATFLLAWNGGPSALMFTPPTAGEDPWTAEATTDVGVPTGARVAVGAGWMRTYSAGVVAVNPSPTATVTVSLGGTYVQPDGREVSSVTLGPASGAILRRTVPTTTTTTTTTAPPAPTTTTTAPPAPTTTTTAPPAPPAPVEPPAWYRLAAADGGTHAFGAAAQLPGIATASPIVGVAGTAGTGSWLAAADGAVFAQGDAPFLGSLAGQPLARPIVGIAATPSGRGYWLVARDGGIFAFGDARFFGSTGGIKLNQPIVGMASTPTGNGYWFVAADGGIFAFGDARFHGSTGAIKLNHKVVGMAPSKSGRGYWLVARDGGVFAFGDAGFFGSTGAIRLNEPIVGMTRSSSGNGYRFVASDGGIFSFGDATYLGSLAGRRLPSPIVGMAADG